MYSHAPQEKMVSVDDTLTKRVQHQVSQSARWNAERVLHSVPMQLPASAVHHLFGDPRTILYAHVAVVQPGRCGDTIVDSVENAPHLEGSTQFFGGRLSILGASASAAADGFWLRNCSYIGAAGGGPAETDGDGEKCVNLVICWACAYDDVVGPGVILRSYRACFT